MISASHSKFDESDSRSLYSCYSTSPSQGKKKSSLRFWADSSRSLNTICDYRKIFTCLIVSSSHSCSFFLAPFLLPTSVVFRNSTSGPSSSPSETSFANPFFSVQPWQLIFYALKLLISFLLCLLRFRPFVYRCSTDCSASPHHQHSGVSVTPVLTRNVLIAPCPVLS